MIGVINKDEIDHLIELRGVFDGWSVAVMKDGRRLNRWYDPETRRPHPGCERRAEVTDAFLAGEEPKGRWW